MTWGSRLDKQLRETKNAHKALKKNPRKHGKKPCPRCNGTVNLVPRVLRTERRVASGGCATCGGDGYL